MSRAGYVMTSPAPPFASFLRDHYDRAFGQPWPVIPSALVIAALGVFLFAFDRPWTASDGLRNWGDWFLQLLGVSIQADLLPPHLYSGSVLNVGLLVGSAATALLSGEFAVRRASLSEMIKGAGGGVLMGAGAMLAFGCNIGGFFSALSALSASGAGMMAGLGLGGFIGARLLIRENARRISAGQMPVESACQAAPRSAATAAGFQLQPLTGLAGLAGALAIGVFYHQMGHHRLAVFLYFGVGFGVIFQRSRFCLVNAFREPFLTGAGEHARATALALVLGMIGFAILKAADLKDAAEWVFPSFWLGALLGGALFGIGMVFAGGCGAGSLWRAGEGQMKLWVALFFFATGASVTRQLLVRSDLIRSLGDAVFLPHVLGWTGAVWGVVALMIIWYLLASWTEQAKRAGVL
jgi:uncharacterized membrane protein YedE/YeeE